MPSPPYGISYNNVPEDFNIFSPVFCADITCQCCLRKSCKWANYYLQYQYVLYILYVHKNLFNIYNTHFTTTLKISAPVYS
jgi:hypothetical protein